jgi:hypothetical protein
MLRSNSSKSIVLHLLAVVFSGFCGSEVRAAVITAEQKVAVAGILSFDYAVGTLGLAYGVDPTHPIQSVYGTLSSSGFSWTASGNYLNSPFSWSNSGTFNPSTDSLTWNGSGSYDGGSWTFSGNISFASDNTYLVDELYEITAPYGGQFTLATIGRDSGFISNENDDTDPPIPDGDPNDQEDNIKTEIKYSKHILKYKGWFGITTEEEKLVVDYHETKVKKGKIVSNTLRMKDEGTSVGITIHGVGGTVSFVDKEFEKTTKLEALPEPSSFCIILTGSIIGLFAKTRNRVKSRTGSSRGRIPVL